jgi:hypothetical protein
LNDNDSDNDHRIQDDEEQEQIDAAAAAAERRLPQLISLLQKKKTFSLRTRNKMDVLVEEFLTKIKDDIHDMLCDDNEIESDDYRGLDSDRDTEKEVETTIRLFPEILSRRKITWDDEEQEWQEGVCPIQYLVYNFKAISFVSLVARLSKEYGLFEEEERGGLLCDVGTWSDEHDNALHDLMASDNTELHNQEHHESIDTKYLQVLIQLRKLGYVKKEDIQSYDLLHKLCRHDYFAEKRFRFLVEWNPSALTKTDEYGCLPIHCEAVMTTSIRGFQHAFEYGIRYFPKKEGISLIFRKASDYAGNTRRVNDKTPFSTACANHGREEVMNVIEETLLKFQQRSDDDDNNNNNNNNNTGPYNVVDTLITAAINENIHLDCLYFLLRREPDTLEKLLSSSSSSTMIGMLGSNDNDDDDISSSSKINTSNNNTNNKGDSKDGRKRSSSSKNDNNSVNDDLLIATSPKKRKR